MKEVDLGSSPIQTVQVTLEQRPPYHSGTMPLVFESGVKAFFFWKRITIDNNFGDFHNTFSYSEMAVSGIAAGARTRDASGALLAEAQVTDVIQTSGQFDGVEIEESHYGKNGQREFKCRSRIDRRGFKINETQVTGKKNRDYYFIWPTSTI